MPVAQVRHCYKLYTPQDIKGSTVKITVYLIVLYRCVRGYSQCSWTSSG